MIDWKDHVDKAVQTALGVVVGAILMGLRGFVRRAIENQKKVEYDALRKEFRDMVNELREEVGKFKMINDAQWRNIEDMKNEMKSLRDRQDRLSDRD